MEQLTLGTNRLIKPTQRRFNGAWLESQQSAIHILPQVASELTNGKYQTDFDLAFEFAQRTLVSVQNRGDDATAFKVKCDLWWLKAITDEASPYQLVELSAEQYRHAAHIREAFPRSVFHRRQNDTLVSCVINKCGFSAQEKGCGEARPAGNTWPYCQGT